VEQHAHGTPGCEREELAKLFGSGRTISDVGEEDGTQRRSTVSEAAHMHERRSGHVQRKAAHGLHSTIVPALCILGEVLGPTISALQVNNAV
jgi:hypothetical protein